MTKSPTGMWSEHESATRERFRVEVVVNGRPLSRKEIDADGKLREVTFTVPVEQSSWICLRILPSSHTNPVWVTVDKQAGASIEAERPVAPRSRRCLLSPEGWPRSDSRSRARWFALTTTRDRLMTA